MSYTTPHVEVGTNQLLVEHHYYFEQLSRLRQRVLERGLLQCEKTKVWRTLCQQLDDSKNVQSPPDQDPPARTFRDIDAAAEQTSFCIPSSSSLLTYAFLHTCLVFPSQSATTFRSSFIPTTPEVLATVDNRLSRWASCCTVPWIVTIPFFTFSLI